jgi:hypothetical protein
MAELGLTSGTVCPSARVPVLDLVPDMEEVGFPAEMIETAKHVREVMGASWGHYLDSAQLIPFICVRGRHFQLPYAEEALDSWAHPSPNSQMPQMPRTSFPNTRNPWR